MKRKVTEQYKAKKHAVLKLDGPIDETPHTKYVVGGVKYDIVQTHGLINCIAVDTERNHVGDYIEFVME